MKKKLLDVIFASEKRLKVLLLLQNEPKEMPFILDSLETTRTSLLPQIKILEENNLVSHKNDTYELTTIGKLLVDEMRNLLEAIDVFEFDIDYWGSHNIDFIPEDLLRRIPEMGQCNIVIPPISESHELLKDFHQSSLRSVSLSGVTTFFHPNFEALFNELMDKNVEIYTIITQPLFDKLMDQYNEECQRLLGNELFHVYLYPGQIDFLSFAYNDYYLLMSLLDKNGNFDNRHVLCSERSSLEWAKGLFEYYLERSKPVTEI